MRSFLRRIFLLGIGLAFLVPGLSPQRGPALQVHGTGLIPVDAGEINRIVAEWPRVSKVRLNRVGLERVNDVRARKGKARLPSEAVKPVGHELESSVYARDARARVGAVEESYVSDRPVFVDNSALKYFPPIRNQGLIGSCAAFATTYTQLSYMTAFERDLDIRSNEDNTNKYSPKWSYNMVNGGLDSGSTFSSNYALLEQHGACTWAEFPYDSDYRAWLLNPSAWRNALSVRTKAPQYVYSVSTDAGLELTKDLLINGYVLVFGTYVYSWQFQTIQNDPLTPDDDGQAGKSICYWLNGSSGGHAMTIVGYNDAVWTDINSNGVVDTGEKGAFRVANSWGTGWGDAGFVWLAYDALRASSMVPGGPSSGRVAALQADMLFVLTAREDYSPSMIAEFTVNHAKRVQLGMTYGFSDTSGTVPTSTWAPAALNYQGGNYAFDGSVTPVDGTFVFDFTDMLNVSGTARRYYLGLGDSKPGSTATLSSFRILDLSTTPATEVVSSSVPQTVDAGTVYASLDHLYAGPRNNHDPALSGGSVSPASGTTSTSFGFMVRYYDPDLDAPAAVNVLIDGVPHAMSLVSGPPAVGYYFYESLLPAGTHGYSFAASDGRGGVAREPIVAELDGPIVTAPHIVSTPNVPDGPPYPITGRACSYSASGSACSHGHGVQYRFEWLNGNYSDWLPEGQVTIQHTWTEPGPVFARVQARCAAEPAVESPWSGYFNHTAITSATKADFNFDDREDILWRYAGSGGHNLVWFLGETGGAASPVQMADPAAVRAPEPYSRNGAIASARILPRDMSGAMSPGASARTGLSDPRQVIGKQARTVDPEFAVADPRGLAGSDVKLAATGPLGLAALPTVPDLDWRIVGTGDFNNDSHVDILWRYNGPGGYLLVWYMNGTEAIGLADLPTVADLNWQVVGTGDFNDDGHVDILWRNAAYGDALVWYMDGINPTGLAALPTVSDLSWEIVGTGDFNNDTHVDILWRNNGPSGYNLVWYLDGTANVTDLAALPTVSDTNWQIVGTGDYDNDTHVDILWRYNGSGGYNVIWFMDGVNPTGLADLPAVPDLNWRIVSR